MACDGNPAITNTPTVTSSTAGEDHSDDPVQATAAVELYLVDPVQASKPHDRCTVEPCTRLVELIAGAKHSIRFAIYGMRDQSDILEALTDAQARGVSVCGVVDRQADGTSIYSSTDAWVETLGCVRDDLDSELELMATEGEPVSRSGCDRPDGTLGPLQCAAYDLGDHWLAVSSAAQEDFASNRIMHNKFVIIDDRWVWTGSSNISNTGTGGYNANAVVVIDDLDVARTYRSEFDQMWSGQFHTMKGPERDTGQLFDVDNIPVELWFSPQNQPMRHAVRPFVAATEHKLNIAAFFLTDKWVTAEIIAAYQRGVDVRVLVDATSARNAYSKHEVLRRVGVPVKVEDWGGKMHMKAASSDGKRLVVGSMNWTSAGNYTNDENTLLIDSVGHASQFDSYFDGLWDSVPDRWAQDDPLPESLHSPASCSDGIDNDFDDLADSDPECYDASLTSDLGHRVITSWKKSEGPHPESQGYQLIRALNPEPQEP